MTLIFSDGIPSDESEMWRVWNKTAYPIATHLIMPIGWLTENEASVALMRALCRGGGRFTCGDTVAELKSGVVTAMAKEPMPYVATARRLPDVSRQVFNGADAAKNHAAVNDRVVELGDEVADVQADVFELQQRQIITDTFNQIISGSDAVAVEAIGVQRERAAVDKESRENASAALTNGLAKLGACILGAVGVGIENRLLASESARQRPAEHAAAPQIGGVTINRELLNRTAAISLARANKTAALPPPSMEPVERPARSKAPAIQAPPSQKPLALSPPHVAASARPLPTSAVIVRKRIFNNDEE
jgi:hypothetical protein